MHVHTCSHGQGGYGRLPHVFDWFTHPVGLPDTRYGRPEIRLITQHHAQQIPTGCKTTRNVFLWLKSQFRFFKGSRKCVLCLQLHVVGIFCGF